MILKSIRIENYRSIMDATLDCDDLTVLVGANGSGKSSFLRAIDLFYAEKPDLAEEDYYSEQTDNDIKITATFKNLSDSAKMQFKEYIRNGELSVVRIFEWNDGKPKSAYHGIMLKDPNLTFVHNDSGKEAKEKYEQLRKTDAYKDFPEWTNHSNAKTNLREWERNNPSRCKDMPDEGNVFKHAQGFPNKFVRFLYVTPVHDATEDAQEGKNTVLAELMNLVVKNSLAERKAVKEFKEFAQKRYRELMLMCEQEELRILGDKMSETVKQFVPDAKVNLSWSSVELIIEPPRSKVNLVEDEYQSAVNRAGHGLQRVFIMSILQHLSEAQSNSEEERADESPTLVLAIDEPELYQHPNRQRHMSQVLLSLTNRIIPGASRTTQVIYSTHSPNFIGIDRLHQIRLVRKVIDRSGGPRKTDISSTNLKDVARDLTAIPEHASETEEKLKRSLSTIMTHEINEGFFADVVVLVEGPGDQAALTAVAKSMNHSLEALGISVIPCNGKHNLGRLAMIFRHLAIPLYVVWDGDSENLGSGLNRILLYIIDEQAQNLQLGVHDTFACLDSKLEKIIEKDLGDKFEKYLNACTKELHLSKDNAIKKPHAIYYMIKAATSDNISFPTLEKVVQSMVRRCPSSVTSHTTGRQ